MATMVNIPTKLDDIAKSIGDLSHMVDGRFTGVEHRLDKVEARVTDLEAGQRDVRERLSYLEGETKALRNDVRELYQLTA